jgi:hypothetical protein
MSVNEPSVDDLLGEEDLGLDPPPAGHEPVAARRGGPRWILIAVGAVVFIILWFISSAHSENYYLVNDDGTVHVEKGWYFPFGSSDWAPSRAYKPFRLPDDIALEDSGAMTAEEVDKTLLDLFRRIARRELRDLSGGNAEQAEDMLLRANKLMHTSIDDERELMRMLGDVHFHQGLSTLKEVLQSFDLAYRQFDLAAQRGGDQFGEARKWADMIKRFQGEFRGLLKDSELDPDQFFGKSGNLLQDALKRLPTAPGTAP